MESEVTKEELAKLLYESIESKSYNDCEDLLQFRGADPNYVLNGDHGSAPIHYAVGLDTEEIAFKFVRLLLKYEADPNIGNWEGTTPLMVAAIWERLQILELLLDFGGDPDLIDNDGYSTMDYAKECHCPSIYDTLIHHGDIFVTKRAKCSPTEGFSLKDPLNENIIYSKSDFSDVESAISYIEVFIPADSNLPPPIPDVSIENCDQSGGSLSSCPTENLREELIQSGIFKGPVVKSTKKLYMNRLKMFKNGLLRVNDDEKIINHDVKIGCNEFLSSCFCSKLSTNLEQWKALELELVQGLREVSKSRHMGEKVFFTYLLLDPRLTQEIVQNEMNLEESELMKLFIKAIFYVGKGKNSRPIDHLHEAIKTKEPLHSSSKVKRIHEIWKDKLGVVCIYAFHNITCTDAHIREAAMLDALDGLKLTNQQKGNYFPPVASWPLKKKMQLGALLLYRAMKIYLGEGESQIMRCDL